MLGTATTTNTRGPVSTSSAPLACSLRNFSCSDAPCRGAWFKSAASNEDYTKPRLLLRACMKLHNACINDRIEEVGSKLSDLASG